MKKIAGTLRLRPRALPGTRGIRAIVDDLYKNTKAQLDRGPRMVNCSSSRNNSPDSERRPGLDPLAATNFTSRRRRPVEPASSKSVPAIPQSKYARPWSSCARRIIDSTNRRFWLEEAAKSSKAFSSVTKEMASLRRIRLAALNVRHKHPAS